MNRALVVGISGYPAPVSSLPAVAADVREIGDLLGSQKGSFHNQEVIVVTEADATRSRVLSELKRVFGSATKDDTVFVYLAGHGSVIRPPGEYYFIAFDSKGHDLPATSVPLTEIKRLFEGCQSRRVFLWLDFCHSGGIIARNLEATTDVERAVMERTLRVVGGEGKLIFAACTPDQYAYEDSKIGHGLFTAYLLDGLRGAAASGGEVTANSLFDFIDRKMGSDRQRPMQFGQMTGRLVLMHYPDTPGTKGPALATPASTGAGRAVNSSGNWCLLGSTVFEAKTVRQSKDGRITVEISSNDAETDALVSRLRPDQFGRAAPIPYAYRNDAVLVRVAGVESESRGQSHVWSVAVKPESIDYGGGVMEAAVSSGGRNYTPDQLAELRARRILLNDPPPPQGRQSVLSDGLIEAFIRGQNAPVPATECVIRSVYAKGHPDELTFLQVARLNAIFMLKASGVCEQVLELSLGPVIDGKCHVRFRGQRRRRYDNVEPTAMEIEGDCALNGG